MKWIKDNGDEIELNDLPETVKKAESLGWKKKQEKQTKQAKTETHSVKEE